jgi:hypothetical protein
MVRSRKLIVLFLGCFLLGAQPPGEDPVMKARSERAKAQGIAEGDLPPVPRGIVEPPPLPPPETHVKDTRGGRAVKSRRGAKGTKGTKAAKSGKQTAKGGRKSSKKVKA